MGAHQSELIGRQSQRQAQRQTEDRGHDLKKIERSQEVV